MASYPTLSKDFDASSFEEESENPVVASEMEGGYTITRARFTRSPRRKFTFKHVDISDADKTTLQTFWDDHKGGASAFNWTHPISGAVINVRFSPDMKLSFKRTGYGENHRWDSDTIELREV